MYVLYVWHSIALQCAEWVQIASGFKLQLSDDGTSAVVQRQQHICMCTWNALARAAGGPCRKLLRRCAQVTVGHRASEVLQQSVPESSFLADRRPAHQNDSGEAIIFATFLVLVLQCKRWANPANCQLRMHRYQALDQLRGPRAAIESFK